MSVARLGAAGAWLGRSGEAVGRAGLLYFSGGAGGMHPDQDATGGMCRHDLQPTGQPAQPHRASACLTRETSTLWDPEQCGERGVAGSSPWLCPPHKGLLGRKGSERQRSEIKTGFEQNQSAVARHLPPSKHFC